MKEKPKPRVGFTNKSTLPLIEAREKVFGAFFGDRCEVNHELAPLVPHIDVYVFEPDDDERDFYTLATGGMSDVPMNAPQNVEFRRAELILYAQEPKEEYISLLRWLAHLIHDQKTWMSHGSTMTNGQPPKPIFADSELDCYLFLTPLLEPDNSLPERLILQKAPVTFLWVVPITQVECDFIRKRGLNDFLDLLDRKEHPIELDEQRESYVRVKGK